MLDNEKMNSFIRVMTQLQGEGLQVEKSKSTIMNLMKDMDQQGKQVPSLSQESADKHMDKVSDKKIEIISTLKYLMNNKESLDDTHIQFLQKFKTDSFGGNQDPIHELKRMSMNELTQAYDNLLNILVKRENLIKYRIKKELQEVPKEERVLF